MVYATFVETFPGLSVWLGREVSPRQPDRVCPSRAGLNSGANLGRTVPSLAGAPGPEPRAVSAPGREHGRMPDGAVAQLVRAGDS